MKATYFFPNDRDYPYFAVHSSHGNVLKKEEMAEYDIVKDLVIISMVQQEAGKDKKPYVQYVFGERKGYFTDHENEYSPLPAGFQITITQ